MANLILNGSTSGSVTLSSPAVSGTATLTLPTTSGTVLTSASSVATSQLTGSISASSLPAGSVLQVVQGSTSTSVMTNNTTATDTGLSASITPSSASNKILIIVTQNYYIQGGDPNSGSILLLRGATTIGTTGDYPIWTTGSTNIGGIYTINYLDSPATTSSVTYKTRQKLRDGAEMFTQRDSVTASTITLMEIKV
jgi:hypothetical protein